MDYNDFRTFLENVLEQLRSVPYVKAEDIPNIPLYMDQVTTFLEDQLGGAFKRQDDKVMTKTMINNYSKNDLLPPSDRKKYSKEHIELLIFIYYFKNVLSISDIGHLLNPLSEKYFRNPDGKNVDDIYKELLSLEQQEVQKVLRDLGKRYRKSVDTFTDFPEEDQEYLHNFAFISMLSYDVYIKRMIIEQLIDDMVKSRES